MNFEVAISNSFRDIQKNYFVTAEADIDDTIKRKRIRVSLKKQTFASDLIASNMVN